MNHLKDSSGEIVFFESKSKYDASQQRILQLEKAVKELEQHNQILRKNIIQKDKDYQLLIEDLDKLRKINEEKIMQRETLNLLKQFKNMEDKIQEQERLIEQLNESNKILNNENLELKSLKNELQNKNSEIIEEKETIFKSYHSKKNQIEELGQQKIKYEEELNKYKNLIQILEEENETLKQEKIDYERDIQLQRHLSFQYQQEAEQISEKLKLNQLIKDQPNQDDFNKKINQSLIIIQEMIIGRIQNIEKELKDNKKKKVQEREALVIILNQLFNSYLRLPLEKRDITLRHEFKNNQLLD